MMVIAAKNLFANCQSALEQQSSPRKIAELSAKVGDGMRD
jgi:hypothetical protein